MPGGQVDDEAAAGAGDHPAERDGEVLVGDGVVEPCQPWCEGFQQPHHDALARAAVAGGRIAAALRDQRPRVGGHVEEALGVEAVGALPQRRVVEVPVEIEQDEGAGREGLAGEGQVGGRLAAHEGGERVEAAHLLGEGRGEGAVVPGQPPAVVGPAAHGVGRERREPADRDGRAQDVQQLHRRDPRRNRGSPGCPRSRAGASRPGHPTPEPVSGRPGLVFRPG